MLEEKLSHNERVLPGLTQNLRGALERLARDGLRIS